MRAWFNVNLPVLDASAARLEALRARQDDIDAHDLVDMITADPLMALKVMVLAGALQAKHAQRTDRPATTPESITAALVMMGLSPFFAAMSLQTRVEDRLTDHPEALAGLHQVLHRAHRAASFAIGFAVHRMDYDADVIALATLLHDFAEMLLWCHAPALALRIRDLQRAAPQRRSREVQREVLNIELPDLQQALMKAWHLPELLVRISDERHSDQANVQCVTLAVQLARHTAVGWDSAPVPDDIAAIAQLLNLSLPATLQMMRDIDSH